MNTDNEKLNKFINAVNDEIDSKIKSIIDDANNQKNIILEQAETEAKEISEKHYNINFHKNDKQFVRDISCAELNAKKAIIQHREKLVDKIFETVVQRLKEFKKTPKYIDMLIKKLLLMHISEDTEIYLSEEDIKYSDLIKTAIPVQNLKITVSDRILLGGVSVYNSAKGTIIDKTFDLALEEKKRDFANKNSFQNKSL